MSKFRALSDALAATGWSIEKLELGTQHWWTKEIWELTSTWSPVGARIFLTFNVDILMEYPGEPPETAVWEVALCETFPQGRGEEYAGVSVKTNFNAAIAEVTAIAMSMRGLVHNHAD